MWVQKDTLRTKQERKSILVLFVKRIHDLLINSLQFILVFNGAKNAFAVFLNILQNADFKLGIVIFTGGNNRNVGTAVPFKRCQNLQFVFGSVLVGNGDKIRAIRTDLP